MFRLLNNLRSGNRGQVAVVIILIVAFALIFYAVTLNMNRVGQNKTSTQIGSNQGASSLASAMASYGHSLLMTQLGGERKKCASTGLLGAIIGAIIAIVIAVYTLGAGAYLAVQILAVAGAVLSVANVALQVTVIQPGITSAWNSLAQDILPIADQFMESALRGALGTATADNHQVPDLYDMDTNGTFGLDPFGEPYDTIGRFGLYYQKVFDNVVINFVPEAEIFQIELQDFVYQLPPYGPDLSDTTNCGGGALCDTNFQECVAGTCVTAWALIDPLPTTFIPGPTNPDNFSFQKPANGAHSCFAFPTQIPSECNGCCLPETAPDPRGPSFGQINVRPGCCDCCSKPPTIDVPDGSGGTVTVTNPDYCGFDPNCITPLPSLECGTASTCQQLSPYGRTEPTLNTFYQWVYDLYYEDYENGFFSFRERLGKDDEHQLYFKDSANPNALPPGYAQQFAPPWNGSGYYIDDVTGFYSGLPVPVPADPAFVAETRIGIFELLYKVHDWGFDLDTTDDGNPLTIDPVDDPNDIRCVWCDSGRGTLCNAALPVNTPTFQVQQLNLVSDPATLWFDTSYCVDSITDDVTLTLTGSFEISSDICADPSSYLGGPFWKRGADRFCSDGEVGGSTSWPYEGQCDKYTDGNCFLDPNRDGVATCPQECDDAGNPIPALCDCGDPSAGSALDVAPALFPEDHLDELIYDLSIFIEEANTLLRRGRARLSTTFTEWFNDWQAWIDPGPLAGDTFPPGAPWGPYGQCYEWDSDYDPNTPDACQPEAGQLYLWHNNIELIKDELVALRDQSFQGAACGSPWCIPPTGCADVTAFEEVTFDANGNGTEGDLDDIIACLTFNVNGYDYACNGGIPDISCLNGPGVDEGNDFRYLQCMLTCGRNECTNLPRSTIPFGPTTIATYDPSEYSTAGAAVADEPDMAAMLACVYNCSNVNCGAMPANRTSTGTPYPYAATLGTFNEAFDCSNFAVNDTNNFRTLIRDSLVLANPICDIAPGGWLQMTGTAGIEAQNLVRKFELRRDFLEEITTELDTQIGFFVTASTAFGEFLAGPVADLIDARIAYDADPPETFPFQVVYGWQDPVPPEFRLGGPGGESYWHIVKVEGRLPTRCDNACGLGGTDDPAWPKVRTYTKKGGFKRCYELVNTDGIVKFRVNRFDESPQTGGTGSGLTFPNGQPIWRFKYFHPNPERADVSAATLGSTCDPIMITDPAVPPDTFKGAFLMNERIGTAAPASPACIAACGGPGCPACTGNCLNDCGDTTPGNNWECWNRSHFILANAAIGTETCAQYYYKGGARPGLTFSFIDCPGAF